MKVVTMNIYSMKVVSTCGIPLPPIPITIDPIPCVPVKSDSGTSREEALEFLHDITIHKVLRQIVVYMTHGED